MRQKCSGNKKHVKYSVSLWLYLFQLHECVSMVVPGAPHQHSGFFCLLLLFTWSRNAFLLKLHQDNNFLKSRGTGPAPVIPRCIYKNQQLSKTSGTNPGLSQSSGSGQGGGSATSAGLSHASRFISNRSPDDHPTAQEQTKSSETMQVRNHSVNITPIAKTDLPRFSYSRNLPSHFPLSAPVMDVPQPITEGRLLFIRS